MKKRTFTEIISDANAESDGGCTCTSKPGDEYYCSVHGGEGSWIDLKVKSDMLIEKLGDWIISQADGVKRSAANDFGDELKALGKTLSKVDEGGR